MIYRVLTCYVLCNEFFNSFPRYLALSRYKKWLLTVFFIEYDMYMNMILTRLPYFE